MMEYITQVQIFTGSELFTEGLTIKSAILNDCSGLEIAENIHRN